MSVSSSWPSRDRSPTPANTEMPWYFSTMAWISSITSTVFPTPAPPNIAAFPPWASGASRSITLMPVSNTALAEVSSFSAGGGAWMPRRGVSAGSACTLVAHRPDDVEQPAQYRIADRDRNRRAGGVHRRAARQSGGRLQCDAADDGGVDVAVDFQHQRLRPVPGDNQRAVDRRQSGAVELHVHDGTANRDDGAGGDDRTRR